MPFDGRVAEQQDAVLEILRRGRERVARPGGWCKDAYRADGALCAIGAIIDTVPITDPWTRDEREAATALVLALPGGGERQGDVERYNDAPGRTQEEIVALYDRAIALREREGGSAK